MYPKNTQSQPTRYEWQKSKLINLLMRDGKKQKAERIVRESILYLQIVHSQDFAKVLPSAVENTGSIFHLKSRRKAAQRLRVPFPLNAEQQDASGLRRLVKEARSSQGGSMGEKLGATLLKAAKGQGKSVEEQRREMKEVRKNRGNLYLRW